MRSPTRAVLDKWCKLGRHGMPRVVSLLALHCSLAAWLQWLERRSGAMDASVLQAFSEACASLHVSCRLRLKTTVVAL